MGPFSLDKTNPLFLPDIEWGPSHVREECADFYITSPPVHGNFGIYQSGKARVSGQLGLFVK